MRGEDRASKMIGEVDAKLARLASSASKSVGAFSLGATSLFSMIGQVSDFVDEMRALSIEGEKAANATIAAKAAIADYATAMARAQEATAGLVEGTDLERYLLTMQRAGIATEDQSRLLTAATQAGLQYGVTVGSALDKIILATQGSTRALARWGVQLEAGDDVIRKVQESFGGVQLREFNTDLQKQEVLWADIKSEELAAHGALGMVTAEIRIATRQMGDLFGITERAAASMQKMALIGDVISRAEDKAKREAAAAKKMLGGYASVSDMFAADAQRQAEGAAALRSAATAVAGARPRRRRGGGPSRAQRARQAADAALRHERDVQAAIEERQAAEVAGLQEIMALERLRLEQAVVLGRADEEDLARFDVAAAGLQTQLQLRYEMVSAAKAETDVLAAQLRLQDVLARSEAKRMSIMTAMAKGGFGGFLTGVTDNLQGQIEYASDLTGKIGTLSAAMVSSEKAQAAIKATFAVADGILAGIRIIIAGGGSAPSVALGIATMALGGVAAAAYGGHGAGGGPRGGAGPRAGGFQARPTRSGGPPQAGPQIININAPIVAGPTQEAGAMLSGILGAAGGRAPRSGMA